jgi:hypothetical protein
VPTSSFYSVIHHTPNLRRSRSGLALDCTAIERAMSGIVERSFPAFGHLHLALSSRVHATYKDGVPRHRTVQSEIGTTLWLFAFGLRPKVVKKYWQGQKKAPG